jgi:CRISPR-associated protein Cas1
MRSLYLLRSHGRAALSGENVLVHQGKELVEKVPLPLLDQILVMGNVQLTTQLIEACLTREVPIAFLSASGWCHGRLQPLGRNYRHRARHQVSLGMGERLQAARQLIAGKIRNGRVLLLRLTRRQRRELVQDSLDRLDWHQQQACRSLHEDRLRGLEGQAACEYFQALGSLLADDGFTFLGRHRRPPTTPFDVLASFGYSVLWNAMYTQIELQGLDPYEGVLHHGSARHAALVSDLIEPLRTLLVDPFNCWRIRTKRVMADRDMIYEAEGMRLTDEARRAWLHDWSHYMAEEVILTKENRGPRWALLEQLVRSFVRFVYDPSGGLLIPERR